MKLFVWKKSIFRDLFVWKISFFANLFVWKMSFFGDLFVWIILFRYLCHCNTTIYEFISRNQLSPAITS